MTATVVLQPGREKSLNRHHPWVFEGAIKTVKGKIRQGDTVDITDSKGNWLARGAYSPHSQIRVRVWTFERDEVVDNAFFLRKLDEAMLLRKRFFHPDSTDSYRIIASESDGLPGVTVDRYGNTLVIQLLSAGAEKHRNKLIWALNKRFGEITIVERSDVDVRQKEGLEPVKQVIQGDVTSPLLIKENAMLLEVDVLNGHKTGFYLDQRDNRNRVRQLANNADVLNCFSYTGTFSCAALKGNARHVTNVDVSQPALDIATRNAIHNDLDVSRITNINADVFEVLRGFHAQAKQFDLVILDPPKFVDSKASLNRACRGYKDINMYGIHAVRPGGLLFTFSCSGLMPADLFQKVVSDAALDAGRTVKIVERLSQSNDHPTLSTFPESYYLKGLVCVVN